MASISKDVGLSGMIAARLVPDEQEEITAGEAIAGLILNGLGCANRPMSLTPQFFANTPLDLWCREGVRAELCNRFKLGRTRDEVYAYGCDLWWSALALAVGAQEGIDRRVNQLDTTSVARTGDDVPEADEHAMTMTPGDSKDHRPELKQAGLALLVSPDGGVPLVRNSWDGQTADTPIFQERAAALIATFQRSPAPRYLVADANLYHEDQAAHLRKLGCITRMPHTRQVVSQVRTPALTWDMGQWLDATTRDQRLE
jgi:transposase